MLRLAPLYENNMPPTRALERLSDVADRGRESLLLKGADHLPPREPGATKQNKTAKQAHISQNSVV
jgi:hypothetical protein